MRGWILVAVMAGCGKDAPPIELRLDAVAPASWPACAEGLTLVLSGSVNPELGGETLDGAVTLGDAAPLERSVTVKADGSFELEVAVDELPTCEGEEPCTVEVGLTVSTADDEASATGELTLFPDALPEVVSASLGSRDLDEVIGESPTSTVRAAEYPEVSVTLADPTGGLAGASASVLLCPEDADPETSSGACLVVGSVFDPADGGTGGEVSAPTGGMPDLACSAQAVADGALFRLWVRIQGHACADPLFLAASDLPLRIADDDCDEDGSAVAEDCDDLDPASYPGAPEVWYDGKDQACDGGDDDDADGDGHAASAQGGDDCDDTLPAVHPGALEVCDGADNDCVAGGAPDGQATVFPADPKSAPVNAPTLAAALAGAPDGATIGVCPGAHVGSFTIGRDLTLVGDPGQPTELVGVAANRTPVVVVADGVTATLRDLVVRDGAAAQGGGISAANPASLTIEGCEITGNQANLGGGIYVGGGQLTLADTLVHGNQAANSGGGLEIRGPGTMAILDAGTVIEDNAAQTLGGGLSIVNADLLADPTAEIRSNRTNSAGGGVYGSGTVSWDGGVITGNTAPWGAGMSFDDATPYGSVRVARVMATGNVATEGGGGLEFESTPTLSLEGVIVDGNTADEGGGVMLLTTGPASFTNVDVTNNTARAGGGVAVLGDGETTSLTTIGGSISTNTADESGGGVEALDATVQLGQQLTGTAIEDNVATTSGGGVFATGVRLSIQAADVRRNTAQDGGGLALDTVDAEIVDGALQNNVAAGNGPSMLLVGSHVRLDGSLVVDSGAATAGVAVAGQLLVVCENVTVTDATRNLVEERALASCYDAGATTFTEYTAPNCNAECN